MNEGRIVKAKNSRRYTILHNTVIQDSRLSMQAKGLFAYLQSLPDDWALYKRELVTHFNNGRDAISSAFKELQEHGLIATDQVRIKGGKLAYNHTVFDDFPENGSNQPYTGFQSTVDAENPLAPCTGKPLTENQSLQSIHNKVNTNEGGKAEKTIETRKREFGLSLEPFLKTYGRPMLTAFYNYWTELSRTGGKRMRFEDQKFFEVSRRLKTWKNKETKNLGPAPDAQAVTTPSPFRSFDRFKKDQI